MLSADEREWLAEIRTTLAATRRLDEAVFGPDCVAVLLRVYIPWLLELVDRQANELERLTTGELTMDELDSAANRTPAIRPGMKIGDILAAIPINYGEGTDA